MDKIINFQLIGNPVNWLIVGIMLYMLAVGVTTVLPYFTGYNPNQQ